MVWFLERNNDVLACEIRQAGDSAAAYEFELRSASGPAETFLFSSPADLISGFLQKQSALEEQGWRPRPAQARLS